MNLAAIVAAFKPFVLGRNPDWAYRRWCVIGLALFGCHELDYAVHVIGEAKSQLAADRMIAVVDQFVILLLGTVGVYIGSAVADARVKQWLSAKSGEGPQP